MHDDEAGHEDRVAAVVKVPVKWIYPAALRIHKGATHSAQVAIAARDGWHEPSCTPASLLPSSTASSLNLSSELGRMTSASKAQRAVAPRAPSWKRKRDDLLRKYQKGNVTKEEAERLMELSQVAATLALRKELL